MNEAHSELIKNEFIEHQSQDMLEEREANQFDQFFIQEVSSAKQEEEVEQRENQEEQKVIFSIIIHNDLYPYNAPHIVVSLEVQILS